MKRLFFLLLLLTEFSFAQIFPGRAWSDQDLGVAVDNAETSLAAALGISDLNITVKDAVFTNFNILTIEAEKIQICGVAGPLLTVCNNGRGYGGTTPAAHSLGTVIRCLVNQSYFNNLAQAVKEITAHFSQVVASGTPSTPIASLSTSASTFGTSLLGTTTAAQTVTLTNSGNSALSIASITVSGDFAQSNTCGSSVAAAASCNISVTFTPTVAGARTGTITITDGASGSPHTVSLTGTGTTSVSASVVPYLASSLSSIPATSGKYTVSVSGTSIPVFSYGGYSYAWFAFSGTANVAVQYSSSISSYTLSPIRKAIPSTLTGGNTVNFTLTQPQKVCLKKVNGTTDFLYIMADPLETGVPPSSGAGIYNVVTTYGADSSYGSDTSSAFNAAIAAANGAGSGTVYVPAGKYKVSNSVHLLSNVTMYLAPGSILEVPAGFSCCFHNSSVIYTDGDTNAKITGRGLIYGNGLSNGSAFFWLFSSEHENSFRVQDVMFLDGQTTALRFTGSTITASNVKIISLPGRLADGIDLESSSAVTIDSCLILSTDDNIAIGSGADSLGIIAPMDGIAVTNTLFANLDTGHTLSIVPHKSIPGTSYIRNVTYSNDDSIDTDLGFAIYPFGGTNVYNVTWQNVGIENTRRMPFEIEAIDCTSWGPGNCGTTNTGSIAVGYVSNVTLSNVTFGNFGSVDSLISASYSGAYIDQIHINKSTISGVSIGNASSMHLDLVGGPITNLTFAP